MKPLPGDLSRTDEAKDSHPVMENSCLTALVLRVSCLSTPHSMPHDVPDYLRLSVENEYVASKVPREHSARYRLDELGN